MTQLGDVLWADDSLKDVTFQCIDGNIMAHRIVLTTSKMNNYFGSIFSERWNLDSSIVTVDTKVEVFAYILRNAYYISISGFDQRLHTDYKFFIDVYKLANYYMAIDLLTELRKTIHNVHFIDKDLTTGKTHRIVVEFLKIVMTDYLSYTTQNKCRPANISTTCYRVMICAECNIYEIQNIHKDPYNEIKARVLYYSSSVPVYYQPSTLLVNCHICNTALCKSHAAENNKNNIVCYGIRRCGKAGCTYDVGNKYTCDRCFVRNGMDYCEECK